jgi:hypothetical protein
MIPLASANAPKTITSEKRLMFGQMMMMAPNAIERAPLMPSAQRAFVICVPTCFSSRCSVVSIDDLQFWVDHVDSGVAARVANRRERRIDARFPHQPHLPCFRSRYAKSPMRAGCPSGTLSHVLPLSDGIRTNARCARTASRGVAR